MRTAILLLLLAPFLAYAASADDASPAPAHVTIRTNLEYGRAGGMSLLLDAGMPDGAGPFPVAIIVHGGGWSGGDKQKDIDLFFDPLTRANFTWFSINYRLAP